MYIDSSAPWSFARWKEITGVVHSLFPDNNTKLPSGSTRDQANHILSYVDQYKQKSTEERIKFSSMTSNAHKVPGCKFWSSWVNKRVKVWKLHARIVEVFHAENLHPLTIALGSGDDSDDLSGEMAWPNGNSYLPLVIDGVVLVLFGNEALNSHGMVPAKLRTSTQAIAQRTWANLRNQIEQSKGRIGKLEEDAMQAFKSKSSTLF
jgi:hypothetical protein